MTGGLRQDVHYALRALMRRPLYALASIAVLAIGGAALVASWLPARRASF